MDLMLPSNYYLLVSSYDESRPFCLNESHGMKEWNYAMDEEVQALINKVTWNLVGKSKDVKLVTCKWVYKEKCEQDGSIG